MVGTHPWMARAVLFLNAALLFQLAYASLTSAVTMTNESSIPSPFPSVCAATPQCWRVLVGFQGAVYMVIALVALSSAILFGPYERRVVLLVLGGSVAVLGGSHLAMMNILPSMEHTSSLVMGALSVATASMQPARSSKPH